MLCINILTTYEVVGSMAHKIFTSNEEQRFVDTHCRWFIQLLVTEWLINKVLNQLRRRSHNLSGVDISHPIYLPSNASIDAPIRSTKKRMRKKLINFWEKCLARSEKFFYKNFFPDHFINIFIKKFL